MQYAITFHKAQVIGAVLCISGRNEGTLFAYFERNCYAFVKEIYKLGYSHYHSMCNLWDRANNDMSLITVVLIMCFAPCHVRDTP